MRLMVSILKDQNRIKQETGKEPQGKKGETQENVALSTLSSRPSK